MALLSPGPSLSPLPPTSLPPSLCGGVYMCVCVGKLKAVASICTPGHLYTIFELQFFTDQKFCALRNILSPLVIEN